MKIYVTGANGTLGKEFCRLASSKFNIIKITRDQFYFREPLLLDQEKCALVHLAWPVSKQDYATSSENSHFQENSRKFISYFKSQTTKSIVLAAGSYMEYGTLQSICEVSRTSPVVPYAISKVNLREWLLDNYSNEAKWVVISNLVTGHDPEWKLIGAILRAKGTFHLSEPQKYLDFIHSEDVALALWKFLVNFNDSARVVIASTGRSLAIEELANKLISNNCTLELGHSARKIIEVIPSTLQSLGWTPRYKSAQDLANKIIAEFQLLN